MEIHNGLFSDHYLMIISAHSHNHLSFYTHLIHKKKVYITEDLSVFMSNFPVRFVRLHMNKPTLIQN